MVRGLVRIRLARFGRRNNPVYNIVVANASKARDAKPIEVLGTYNPVPKWESPTDRLKGVMPIKEVNLNFGRSKYWIGVGAQPSDTVTRIFKKCGILDENWGSMHNIIERETISPPTEID
ncbi:hypothetical protein KAFR_0B01750 [Kazachstania africana CBS 2517]|uniref:Ribosomal protein S16 n=1 Tax=Kazachstania africana (strain ATCC 22294 / BCRC 22015 / CBS 2517 / CECT 1963 / NBRC 1671 / NRRL Y-8276) TaxID=1071382 RepID=H2AQ24_KAZAF|nr:hypothetical protein KAFR_0B01750 [Kazachstania africana CBS 2517]CCF56474.1 hypothetical protein KAFR_0B01750 [Kazachstania africana CBS 2517]